VNLRSPALSTSAKLFLTAWIVYSAHFATDIVREHYPAFALGERGTLSVDHYLGLHPDLFAIEGRGVFINNNPGASLVGAIPYALFRPAIDIAVERVVAGREGKPPPEFNDPRPNRRAFFEKTYSKGLDIRFGLAAGVVQAFGFAPLAALMVVVMFRLLLRFGFSHRESTGLALLYAFGTPLFFRTGFLNHNLLVAHATLACLALLYEPGRVVQEPRRLAFAGIAIGFGLLCDYAGAVPVIVMGIYALARLASVLPPGAAVLRMAPMIAGACIPIGALLAYQAWAFGHPLFPAQQYMPATQYSGEGWNGFDWPALDLLFQNLFDRRFGLFAFGPILLAALAHPFIVGRETARVKRPELWLGFGLFAALLLFTSANQFARLQWNTGFRMLAALIPPLFIVCADVLTRLPHRFLVPLGVVAIFHSWCIAMIRADAWESLTAVLSSGPKLPWLTSIWRAGGTYLPFEASASLLALPFLVLSALGVVATWTRADAPHSPAAHSD
jgi:hypothetical protein